MSEADQSSRDVTTEAIWMSLNPSVLTVTRGSAMGLAPGRATLAVRFEGRTATTTVLVKSTDGELAAALVIESLTVTVNGPTTSGDFGYLVRFRLRETAGASSATIGDVAVSGPSGVDWTGPGCWRDELRVPAGGNLYLFDTDAGLKWLSYCAPVSGGRTPTPSLRVLVNFIDEGGRSGWVEAVVTATP